MQYNEADWTYTLSTGKKIKATLGVLGLGQDARDVHHGFDGTYGDLHDGEIDLTPAERQEVADEMIRRWTVWANASASADRREDAP